MEMKLTKIVCVCVMTFSGWSVTSLLVLTVIASNTRGDRQLSVFQRLKYLRHYFLNYISNIGKKYLYIYNTNRFYCNTRSNFSVRYEPAEYKVRIIEFSRSTAVHDNIARVQK